MTEDIIKEQHLICNNYSAKFTPVEMESIVGISENTNGVYMPINGLRHPPKDESSGWYIWSGEHLGQSDDFFKPKHAKHLTARCPQILKFLALPPGYRFLIDVNKDYADVWYDPTLLDVDDKQ